MDRDGSEKRDGEGSKSRYIRIGKIYESFAHEYGFTREYIQGEWKTRQGGKRKLIGFTRPLLKLYWKYLQERKTEEIKSQIRMLGGHVEDSEEERVGKEKKALDMVKNPLNGFPNDIKYFNKKQCLDKIDISNRFGDKIREEKRWNQFRMESCLGKHGPVAKRCSMNDVLWGRFLKYGDKLSLDDIKKMIMFDMKRRELYPSDYKGTGKEPPPVEYLKQLKKKGKLDKIYKELNALGKL